MRIINVFASFYHRILITSRERIIYHLIEKIEKIEKYFLFERYADQNGKQIHFTFVAFTYTNTIGLLIKIWRI